MTIDPGVEPATVLDRPLRLAATLLVVGQLLYIVITQFHTGGHANDHHEIFGAYADSGSWKAVHVGQFLAMSVIVAGLIALYYAFNTRSAGAALAARLGAVAAGVALALYAALQAVDGVGNKEVDSAWVNASDTDKAASFASAEAMRWLEWGMRSYHDYALGLALVLLATAAVSSATLPRVVGLLMGLSGVAYLAQGWVVGAEGFSGTNSVLIVVAWALSLVWMAWILIGAARLRQLRPEALAN